MAVFFIPALIASPIAKENVGAGIQTWCYLNNPWEAWAYAVQHQEREVLDGAAASMLWPGWAIILSGLLFMAGFVAMLLYIIFSVW